MDLETDDWFKRGHGWGIVTWIGFGVHGVHGVQGWVLGFGSAAVRLSQSRATFNRRGVDPYSPDARAQIC
jgi:hypothetical protein